MEQGILVFSDLKWRVMVWGYRNALFLLSFTTYSLYEKVQAGQPVRKFNLELQYLRRGK
jgi:hypothetical protein